MLPLPSWAMPHFLSQPCIYCRCKRKAEWICGVGVREIKNFGQLEMEKGNYGLCFEYMCYDCNRISMTIIDLNDPLLSVNDIVKEIAHTILSNDQSIYDKKVSCISDKEVEDLKGKISNMDHEDFLKYIGMSSEQINKYSKYKSKDGQND